MGEIIIIAAMSENRVIGKNGTIPWSLKEDMAHFRKLTTGWPCIMGRKTWDSLPRKPLPGRLNIIVSGTLKQDCVLQKAPPEELKISPNLPDAIQHCGSSEKIFICGGEAVYREALPLANKIELTLIRGQYEGDAFFPEIDAAVWTRTGIVNFEGFSFITLNRR